jgi:3-oxoacyl-[acyl-carrier protein] reductase
MTILSLRGKTALITGVSRRAGIGAGIVAALAEAGADIFTTWWRPYDATMEWGSRDEEAEGVLADARSLGVRAAGVEADLSDPAVPAQIFDAVEAALGKVSILVNNATHSTHTPIETLSAADLDAHYAVNLRGTALLCAEFVRRYTGGPGGRIISFSSGQGVGPMPDELAYIATKGAIEALTLSLSAAVAVKGITVNAIDPGITDTGWIPPELKTVWAQENPFGRLGTPADAARLVRFLASDEGEWITGQVIHARGGR